MDLESLPSPFLADLVRMDPAVRLVSKRFLDASRFPDIAFWRDSAGRGVRTGEDRRSFAVTATSARRFVTSPARYELALAMTAKGTGSADGIRHVAVAAACASAGRGDPSFLWYFTRKFAAAHRRYVAFRRSPENAGDRRSGALGSAGENKRADEAHSDIGADMSAG